MILDVFRTHTCSENCPHCYPHILIKNEYEGRLIVKCITNNTHVTFTPKFEYLVKKAIYEN